MLGTSLLAAIAENQNWDPSRVGPHTHAEQNSNGTFTVWGQVVLPYSQVSKLTVRQRESLISLIQDCLSETKRDPKNLSLLPAPNSAEWAPVVRSAREVSIKNWRFAVISDRIQSPIFLYSKDFDVNSDGTPTDETGGPLGRHLLLDIAQRFGLNEWYTRPHADGVISKGKVRVWGYVCLPEQEIVSLSEEQRRSLTAEIRRYIENVRNDPTLLETFPPKDPWRLRFLHAAKNAGEDDWRFTVGKVNGEELTTERHLYAKDLGLD